MPVQILHDRYSTENTIDASAPWTLTPAQSETSSNQVLKLRMYHAGLEYIYQIVRQAETAASPAPAQLAPIPLYCFFEWYAVTANNYTDLVASLAIQHGFMPASPDARSAINAYTASVSGNVVLFRNKVAAHTAHVFPLKNDNDMDKELSILPTMPLVNGRFLVGGYSIANSRQRSQHNYSWALTTFHEDFVKRYPKF
jgi:hypothetical protein